MRKTVHEWLETHDRGRHMGKKRRGQDRLKLPLAQPTKKKSAPKKSQRKPR